MEVNPLDCILNLDTSQQEKNLKQNLIPPHLYTAVPTKHYTWLSLLDYLPNTLSIYVYNGNLCYY